LNIFLSRKSINFKAVAVVVVVVVVVVGTSIELRGERELSNFFL
jgi:hypothetical protein